MAVWGNKTLIMAVVLIALIRWAAVPAAAASDELLELSTASLEEIQAAMESGALSSVELTVLYLNRVFAYDHAGLCLNAVPVLNPHVLDEAARADRLRAAGMVLSPLHGVPVVFKDSFKVAGLPTSVGISAWREMVPPDDAFIVARMRRAGAVILGKSNLDSFAADMLGTSDAFGRIKNPYGAATVSGSSGGSAVAVAANLAGVAFGSDTAGSLRMPASRNNVVSIRPTLGLVSTVGNTPADPFFDVVGPMARSVRDLAMTLDIITAPDSRNPMEPFIPPMPERKPASYDPGEPAAGRLRGVVFAVPKRLIATKSARPHHMSPGEAVLDVFARVRKKLEDAGAQIREVDVPVDRVLDDTWYEDRDLSDAGPEAKDIYAARAALINIRVFARAFEEFCRGWCGDPATRMLDVIALVDSRGMRERFEALRDGAALEITAGPARDALLNAAALADGPLFGEWMARNNIDALLFPASSNLDPDPLYGFNYLNELGAPGLFLPMGYTEASGEGSGIMEPVGLTIVTPRFTEKRLLELGAAVEALLQARVPPPATPALPDEVISLAGTHTPPGLRRQETAPVVTIEKVHRPAVGREFVIAGTLAPAPGAKMVDLRVYADGLRIATERNGSSWTARLQRQDGDVSLNSSPAITALIKDESGNSAASFWHQGRLEKCEASR